MGEHPDRHLREYLHHRLMDDPQGGLRAWADAFDAARQAWDVERCRWLLAEIRRGAYDHIPRVRGLALDRHGQWLMQMGAWEEAVRRFEQSLTAFREAGDEQRYQLNLRSILERVASHADAGAVSRARSICRTVMKVWRQALERAAEALEAFSQVI